MAHLGWGLQGLGPGRRLLEDAGLGASEFLGDQRSHDHNPHNPHNP